MIKYCLQTMPAGYRLIKIILINIMGLLFIQTGHADDQSAVARQYNFRDYTLFDGLPQGQVISINQDERGYLWFGSYAGITRFNGRQFDNYTLPLPSNTIRSIVPGRANELIIGSAAGLCILRLDEFTCEAKSEKLPFDNIFKVFVADDESLWLGTDYGVMHITDNLTRTYTKEHGLPTRTVRMVVKDRFGKTWAATDKGLVYLQDENFKPIENATLSNVPIRALLDSPEGLWIGSNEGLFLLEHQSQQLVKVGGDRFAGNGFLALYKDSRDILWMGTYQGLYRMVAGKIEKLSPQKGLKSVTTYAIHEDKEGTLWFGSDAGLIKYVPGPFVTYSADQGLSHEFVRAISIADDGSVWMGTRHGISIFEPSNESFTTLVKQLKVDQVRIYAVKHLPDSSVLIGTQNGLIHWKGDQVKSIFSTEDQLPSSYVSAFEVDQQQRVWIGTSHGLIRWENDHLVPVKQSEFTIGGIYSLQVDNLGRLWLGTGNQGVVIFNPQDESYTQLKNIPQASEFSVWSIDKDDKGKMWIGTNGNGLLEVNQELELLNKYDQQNGLKNNYVWQVMVDSKQQIWAFTNNGLKRFNGQRFEHFDGSDGLPDLEGAATAIAEHPNGDLWFGTGFGVVRYSPNNEISEARSPPIRIESVRFGEQVIAAGQALEYAQGAINFQFASLTFQDEREVQFSYRLLGADDHWSQTQLNNRTQFSNLAPGDYEFQVKAIIDNRLSSDYPASFQFSVVPPFWLTWWFIVGCFVLSFGIISLLIFIRLRLISAERDRLESVVKERTRELTSTNAELKRMANTDELTGLHNRRYLIEKLNSEIRRLTRSPGRTALALIILDVDHFKKINDSYGHQAGDRVLRELAVRIRTCSREADISARYGGEEFAFLLPLTDTEGAMTCANKIRQAILDKQFSISAEQTIPVTVSLGISILYSDSMVQDDTVDRIIGEADTALYTAKNEGRDRICVYQSHP